MTVIDLKGPVPVRENDNSDINQALSQKGKHTGERRKVLGREETFIYIVSNWQQPDPGV